MPDPRPLTSPPISEALVDIRTAVNVPGKAFEELAREFRAAYPKLDVRRGFRAELKVEDGKLVPPKSEDLGFQGVFIHNEDATVIAQFRPDGFTLNNVIKNTIYIGGDQLIAEALRLWSRFAEAMRPMVVTRVALRYINQLRLPFREGDDFSRFLAGPPVVPPKAPQQITEFLQRVVAIEREPPTTVITTQKFGVPEPGVPVVIIDIDAFRNGEFATDAQTLRAILDALRALKNRTFFAMLTDEAISLYA